jgi:Protein of unknown function (DUF1570)
MSNFWWLAALTTLPLQIPRPSSAEDAARELHAAYRSILEAESIGLKGLADQLDRSGDAEAAGSVRARLLRPPAPDGPTRFMPLPDVVAPRPAVKKSAADARAEVILSRSAMGFFDLAQRAAKANPPRYALAGQCLRAAVERSPDHAEARRLLGYVPHEGGWARPFAVEQFRKGFIDHPVFGWVKADWKPHLDRGELPSPPSRGPVRWLSAAEADRLRAGWKPPWQIPTEHFQIQSNVPLAEVISFGRRLEAFHQLFMALMADVQGDNSPLARRFRDPRLTGEPATKHHTVYYFASKDEYLDHLRPTYGAKIELSIGFYPPPKSSTGRNPAYFFRDPDGDLPVTANLYHEVSHQLLFETAGPNHYTQNSGNYWVFEGLGTYFETVEPQPDGSLEVGGRVGRRMEEAIRSLVDLGRTIPLEQFVAYDEAAFARDDSAIYLRYQQAMALTDFLMQWHDGAYREGFLDYVRDAYRGRIRAGTGRKLQDRVGETYANLEAQLLSFLKGPERAGAEPNPPAKPRTPSGGAIRTVPRS